MRGMHDTLGDAAERHRADFAPAPAANRDHVRVQFFRRVDDLVGGRSATDEHVQLRRNARQRVPFSVSVFVLVSLAAS